MAIAPLNPGLLLPASGSVAETSKSTATGQSFTNVIKNLLTDANAQQVQADQAVQLLATGQTDNLHHVMLAVAKADLTLHMILEIRNRLSDAYQEIMRMQV
jgi:flagellar hook-basal body complex protein FliE